MHRAHVGFWKEYRTLPADIRDRADKQIALLRANPRHPSLQFKKLAEGGGQHDAYEGMIQSAANGSASTSVKRPSTGEALPRGRG